MKYLSTSQIFIIDYIWLSLVGIVSHSLYLFISFKSHLSSIMELKGTYGRLPGNLPSRH